MLLYIDSNLQLMYNNIDFNFGKVNHMKKLLLILNSILLIAVTCACTSNASPSVNDIPTASPDALPSADVSPTPSDEDKFAQTKRVTHYMDFSDTTGKIINNKLKNMNMWSFNAHWLDEATNQPEDYFKNNLPFVENIEFMQATGGCDWRDLFVDPYDRSVLDDYYFDNLILACRNALKQGIKPWIKTGNVPMKYSANYTDGVFGVNVLPPDNYDVYYNYIHAIAEALVNEFGLAEVQSWTWGVYTEYENADWFNIGTPQESAVEFCKIYDYTVAALIDVLGNDINVGAHSMSCTEGKWDEAIFLEHCVNGINYATGEIGSRITYTAVSYYDVTPNDLYEDGLAETIRKLRKTLSDLGLDIPIGVDEGRILNGTVRGAVDIALGNRIIGQTYQAAYDARTYDIMIENNIDYFSAWAYTSNEVWEGLPTVSMHTANLFYKMVGSEQLKVNTVLGNAYFIRGENKAVAAYDKESGTINIMAYNFIPNLDAPEAPEKIYYSGETVFSVKLPDDVKKVKITLTPVDDDCNYFDDWLDDMEKYNIPPEHFSWSPDSTNEGNLYHPESKEIFNSQRERYMECSRLNPTEYTADVIDGICTVTTHVPMNTVMFCTIEPIE